MACTHHTLGLVLTLFGTWRRSYTNGPINPNVGTQTQGCMEQQLHLVARADARPVRRGCVFPPLAQCPVCHLPRRPDVTESLDLPVQVHESRKGVVVVLARPPGPRAEQLRDFTGCQTGPALRLHVKAGGTQGGTEGFTVKATQGHTPFTQRSQRLTRTLIKSQVSTGRGDPESVLPAPYSLKGCKDQKPVLDFYKRSLSSERLGAQSKVTQQARHLVSLPAIWLAGLTPALQPGWEM